jgi:hypothetical protein
VIHRQAGTRPSASWVFVPRHPPASAGGCAIASVLNQQGASPCRWPAWLP